jgi:hypothetical protein
MMTQITPRDWETLSAYLDDQLGVQERNELESRLVRDPALNRGLDELRSTRMILRSLPKLRAPRNFTLTPSMAGQKVGASTTTGAYPLLRLASMLATLFFILVSAGGLALRISQPAQTVVMSSDQAAQPAPNFGMGGGGGGGGPASNAAPALEPLAPTEAAVSITMEKAPAETESAQLQVTPLTPALPESTQSDMPPAEMPKALALAQGSPQAQPPNAPAPQELARQAQPTPPSPVGGRVWTLLILLQVLLAVLALASGIAAVYLRRSGRL